MRDDLDSIVRSIRTAKLCTPCPGEYVDECHYSRTGWAIWKKDGGCTCQPARKPKPESNRHD